LALVDLSGRGGVNLKDELSVSLLFLFAAEGEWQGLGGLTASLLLDELGGIIGAFSFAKLGAE
jgi:hypothetical protein